MNLLTEKLSTDNDVRSRAGFMQVSRVGISDLYVEADIGINPDEIGVRQTLIVDITAELRTNTVDDLCATIDYRTLAEIVERIAAERTGLIETFAQKIADAVIAGHPTVELRVRVRKPGAIAHGIAETELALWRREERHQPDGPAPLPIQR